MLPQLLPHIAEYTGAGGTGLFCLLRYLVLSSENNLNRNVATLGEALVTSAVKCHPDALRNVFKAFGMEADDLFPADVDFLSQISSGYQYGLPR